MLEPKCNIEESRMNPDSDRDYKLIFETDMNDEGGIL